MLEDCHSEQVCDRLRQGSSFLAAKQNCHGRNHALPLGQHLKLSDSYIKL